MQFLFHCIAFSAQRAAMMQCPILLQAVRLRDVRGASKINAAGMRAFPLVPAALSTCRSELQF
jgi:hypothetical protein